LPGSASAAPTFRSPTESGILAEDACVEQQAVIDLQGKR